MKISVYRIPVLLLLVSLLALPVSARAQTAFGDPPSRGGTGATAGGDLVPVTPNIDGGEISVGATSQIVILFRNDSGRPLQTGAIQLYPSSTVSANVALNNCNQEELPAAGVCAVSISVKGLQAGSWRVEMLMRHSGRARLVTATLSGTVSAADAGEKEFISDVEAIPTELDFGDLQSAQSVVRGVVLRNITSEPIDISSIYIEASSQSGYSLRTDCSRLMPGQACIVTVTWSPVLEGQASGVLLIEHSGPTSVASVKLDGEYQPEETKEAASFPRAVPGKGLLVASQEKVDFGSVASTSAITVSLVNIGDAPLVIGDVQMASGDNGVSVSKKGCAPGTVLEPVEACPLTLSWSPVREGAVVDDVQIAHDGARGVLVLPVRGTSTSIISQDTKAIRIASSTSNASLEPGETMNEEDREVIMIRDDSVDPASVLDGFVVTSHSQKRGIISGPGGSRIVYDGEEVVIGGFLWNVNIRTSGVEFRSGDDKVLLLFDRSLSSVNRVTGQSGGGSGSSGSSTGTSASTATTAATGTN